MAVYSYIPKTSLTENLILFAVNIVKFDPVFLLLTLNMDLNVGIFSYQSKGPYNGEISIAFRSNEYLHKQIYDT